MNISGILENNSYPGRGIILGKSPDGKNAVMAYFIMGRSENSRNRIFEEIGTADMRTKAFDEAKLSDPSLIIYNPVRVLGDFTIVTNGDQTDTVFDFIKNGESFEKALDTREFEPDAPNFTPRISGLVSLNEGFTYKLSILKSNNQNGDGCNRFYYNYVPENGVGHFIHTYKCDGNPIPSFEGEPTKITTENDINAFTKAIWDSLNSDNKVSLFVRYVDIKTKEITTKIINKL